MKSKVATHCDLEVYQKAFAASMEHFALSKTIPKAEIYALTDQLRRSSRSVCANMAEAWRKRRYKAAFIAKLSDAEGEAAETQVWIQYSVRCQYMARNQALVLYKTYDEILRMIVAMINRPQAWLIQ